MTAVAVWGKKVRRARPEDGGILWHEPLNAFECLGCGEFEEMRRRRDRTPEQLALLRELLVADHTECWEFDDPRMARLQRRFRKGLKRQKIVQRAGFRGMR